MADENEEIDIDLNDPEVGKAAVKIQAGFKNFMAKKKNPNESPKKSNPPIVDNGENRNEAEKVKRSSECKCDRDQQNSDQIENERNEAIDQSLANK
uniref:Uncharacterized protein n=1 Tax=Sarcoptes scabiei TaxID=52283 RepID=A0A834RJS0_SARSC